MSDEMNQSTVSSYGKRKKKITFDLQLPPSLQNLIINWGTAFDVRFWSGTIPVPHDLRDSEILVTYSASKEILTHFPRIKLLQVWGTGTDQIDIPTMELGVEVRTMGGSAAPAIAEWVLLMILYWERDIAFWSKKGSTGDWTWHERYDSPFSELRNRTLGIVGVGHIGTEVARIACFLGMKILAIRNRTHILPPSHVTLLGDMNALPRLFALSDYVSLHCPLTDKTIGLVNSYSLKYMQKSAVLLNAARGRLVVEDDLLFALKEGRIRGASLDTTATEPLPRNSPLCGTPRLIITCHQAGFTLEAIQRGLKILASNIRELFRPNLIKG